MKSSNYAQHWIITEYHPRFYVSGAYKSYMLTHEWTDYMYIKLKNNKITIADYETFRSARLRRKMSSLHCRVEFSGKHRKAQWVSEWVGGWVNEVIPVARTESSCLIKQELSKK